MIRVKGGAVSQGECRSSTAKLSWLDACEDWQVVRSMVMTPANIIQIKSTICELAGVDQIPPIVARYLFDNVLHALTYIFNQSLC